MNSTALQVMTTTMTLSLRVAPVSELLFQSTCFELPFTQGNNCQFIVGSHQGRSNSGIMEMLINRTLETPLTSWLPVAPASDLLVESTSPELAICYKNNLHSIVEGVSA